MKEEPTNTWELAKQLEYLAKLLKKAPKFVISKQFKEMIEVVRETDEISDYEKLKVVELRHLCKRRDIKIPSRFRKAEIIRLLEDRDAGIKTIDKIYTAFSDR